MKLQHLGRKRQWQVFVCKTNRAEQPDAGVIEIEIGCFCFLQDAKKRGALKVFPSYPRKSPRGLAVKRPASELAMEIQSLL